MKIHVTITLNVYSIPQCKFSCIGYNKKTFSDHKSLLYHHKKRMLCDPSFKKKKYVQGLKKKKHLVIKYH